MFVPHLPPPATRAIVRAETSRDAGRLPWRPLLIWAALVTAIVALILGAPPAADAAPPTDAELATACHQTVARVGTQVVKARLKATAACAKAWRRCEGRDDTRCAARAERACAREHARLERARTRGTRAIREVCGGVSPALLLEAHGLGYRLLGDACDGEYGAGVAESAGIAACLAAQHECYAAAIHDALQPSDATPITSVAPELAVVGCPDRLADAAGIDAPLDTRCATRLQRLLTSGLFARLKTLQRCSDRVLRCALAPAPECTERAVASCRARLERIDRRLTAKRDALITRCDDAGSRSSVDCASAERSATVAGATLCLDARAECWASELLQFESPRGHALLDALADNILGDDCATATLPTALPTPPAEGELPLEGAGGTTATPAPAATPVPPATSAPGGDATPIIAGTDIATPTPTTTATPRPTPTTSPCIGYALAVDPSNPDVLYTSIRGEGFFKNTTGGRAPWSLLGLQNVVVNEIAINPDDTNTVHVGTEGQGVLRSASGGQRFDITGLFAIQNSNRVRALALDPEDPEIVYAGTNGGGLVRSLTNGNAWEVTSLFSLPGGAFVRALVVSPRDPEILVAGVANSGAYTSEARGRRWSFTSLNALPGGASVVSLAADPLVADTIYAGTRSGDMFQSPDGGNAWFQTNFGAFGTGQPRAIAVGLNNPAVVYASRDGDIDKSPDRGVTWQMTGFAARAGATIVCDVVVAPGDLGALFANTNDGRVFTSTNGGTTWSEISNGL